MRVVQFVLLMALLVSVAANRVDLSSPREGTWPTASDWRR